jgi:hypothetical protein
MLTFITFPEGFATSTLAVAGALLADLSPYLYLVLGVLLTVLIVVVLIRAIHH